MFTQFDIVVSVVTLFFIVLGFFNGAIKTVFSIGKWVGAWYITTRFYPQASEFVGEFMQPGMVANAVAVGGLGLVSLIGVALVGSMLSATVSGTIGGGLDKVLGIGLGLVEGFLIASILHYCVVLFKGETPAWLEEGQTFQYTEKGADMFDKLLKGKLDNVKIAYDENIEKLSSLVKNPDKYDMDKVNSEITKMSKKGASDKEISSKLNNDEFMSQFLNLTKAMQGNLDKSSASDTKNLMKNLTGDIGLELDHDKAE